METDSSDSPAAAAAGCPRWVMVNRHSYRMPAADADAKTTSAASHTSAGQLFRVSFRLTAPPACSSFYHDWAGSDDVGSVQDPQIVTAHGDCLLLEVTVGSKTCLELKTHTHTGSTSTQVNTTLRNT